MTNIMIQKSIRKLGNVVPGAWLVAWVVVVCLVATGCDRTEPSDGFPRTSPKPAGLPSPSPAPVVVTESAAKVLAEFNRGAALTEQYKYADAAKAFESVLAVAPDWLAARFNLGIAYFNMHGQREAEQSLEAARRAFEEVLAAEPRHLHARFCLGLYYQYLGNNEKSLECFEAVSRADGEDPYATYKYAETLIATGRHDEGRAALEKVVVLDPGFISAIYRLALQYRRAKKPDEAIPLFERFKKLNDDELAGGKSTVQMSYGAAGKYYQILGADNLPLPGPETGRPTRIVFSPEIKSLEATTAEWKSNGGSIGMVGIAAGDVDDDGDLDLFLTATGGEGSGSLWLNDGSGGFSAVAPVAERCVSPCLGDVDNDGDLDLWLGRAGADILLKNDGTGKFAETGFAGPSDSKLLTTQSRLLDIDSDGDLDLFAFRLAEGTIPSGPGCIAGTSSVFNNNRDGSFADVAAELGLALADMPVASVVADDFDNDRDLDLVIFSAGEKAGVIWVNDRVGQFRILDASANGLEARGTISATSGDPDKDGDRDLLVFGKEGVQLFRNRGQCRFDLDSAFADRHGPLRGTGGQFADMDNDGDLDILIADAYRGDGSRGPALLVNEWPRDQFIEILEIDPGNLLGAVDTGGDASGVVADFTGNGRCDVLLAPLDREPVLIENVTPGGHWIELDLRGTATKDKKTRSNNSAIGARVEIKTGTMSQQFLVGTTSGPVAMAPLRIHAGLGDHPKIDWLRILWPDAVLQAEVEVAGDRVALITELSRKTSSCPYLFAWNGSRFEFVGDFGGVGGLGYLVEPGVFAPPDPTEYIRVPGLQPSGSDYVLNAITVLEEVTYFDEAKLIAVDHPQGTEVHPHEMMAITAPPPPFEVFCFREPIDPVRAVDYLGTDVTEEVLRVDRRYAGAVRPDVRFTGLAEEHFVELDFGDRLEGLTRDARLVLLLHGWVEYGYSSTNRAAGQAGLRLQAPSIRVLRDGEWVEVFGEVGYPAGVMHVMTLDVTGKLLPGDRRIRITSNMELYWDRISLAVHLDDAELTLKEVSAKSADLHYFGYPREYSPDGRHPNLCDYDNVDRTATWKLMSGDYTRYGEVSELLGEADDCYAIMGRGEELTLRFPVEAFGSVPEGRQRTFILKTDSYCKDMDLNTAYPDTVEPLPFHGMSGYPYGADEHYPDDEKRSRYRREFNTRRVRAR